MTTLIRNLLIHIVQKAKIVAKKRQCKQALKKCAYIVPEILFIAGTWEIFEIETSL
jgi:hypothetical protein